MNDLRQFAVKSIFLSKVYLRVRSSVRYNRLTNYLAKFMISGSLPPFYQTYFPRLPISMLDPRGLINQNANFVYFRIPKAANSTIVASLHHAYCGETVTSLGKLQPIKESFYTRPSELSSEQLYNIQNCFFKFTFVRNPYTRILAAYQDKVESKEQGKRKLVARALGKEQTAEISLDDFLTYLEAGGIKQNAHWAKQVDLIPIPLEELDFIGKVESLSDDLSYIIEKLFNSSHPIISVREHATNAPRTLLQLGSRSQARIYSLYEEDFETFNYRRGLEKTA